MKRFPPFCFVSLLQRVLHGLVFETYIQWNKSSKYRSYKVSDNPGTRFHEVMRFMFNTHLGPLYPTQTRKIGCSTIGCSILFMNI